MRNRTIALSLGGSVVVGSAAAATYGEGYPTATAPNSMTVELPALILAFAFDLSDAQVITISFAGAAAIFLLWALPFAVTTGARIPVLSRAFALLSILGGVAWLVASIPTAAVYDASLLLVWYGVVDLATALLLLVNLRSNLKAPSPSTFALFHTALFAWLFWCGAPAIGNLNGVEFSVDPALL